MPWVDLSVCLLYPLKQRDVWQRNFACRHVPSACRTFAWSYINRGNRWEENEHFIQLTEGKENTTCWVPYFLHCAECRVPTFLPYNVSMGTDLWVQARPRQSTQHDRHSSGCSMQRNKYSSQNGAPFRLVTYKRRRCSERKCGMMKIGTISQKYLLLVL